MKKIFIFIITLFAIFTTFGCEQKSGDEMIYDITLPKNVMGRYEEENKIKTNYRYNLLSSHEVDGRQGIAYYNNYYYISGSSTLSFYDKNWELVRASTKPFEKIKEEVNHIGDIDVYNNEIYAGVEYFMDGKTNNIQIAIYDSNSLDYKRSFNVDPNSGQNEVSGIAIDPDSKSIWLCSWDDSDGGKYLYRYNLENGNYIGKYHLQPSLQWIQGITYYDGYIYISADDGTADLGEADHIYRVKVDVDKSSMPVMIERTLDDVTLQGEIEGLSFDKDNKQLLVSYNRGAKISLGMPKGYYEGYNKEIHEIFVYGIKK